MWRPLSLLAHIIWAVSALAVIRRDVSRDQTWEQVYLLFDNIELFLIFAGNQLGKLKVVVLAVVVVAAVVVVMVVVMRSQSLLHSRHLLHPHATPMLPGPLFFIAYFRPKFRCENALHAMGSALRCSRCPLRRGDTSNRNWRKAAAAALSCIIVRRPC
jgi:hypothetical protein